MITYIQAIYWVIYWNQWWVISHSQVVTIVHLTMTWYMSLRRLARHSIFHLIIHLALVNIIIIMEALQVFHFQVLFFHFQVLVFHFPMILTRIAMILPVQLLAAVQAHKQVRALTQIPSLIQTAILVVNFHPVWAKWHWTTFEMWVALFWDFCRFCWFLKLLCSGLVLWWNLHWFKCRKIQGCLWHWLIGFVGSMESVLSLQRCMSGTRPIPFVTIEDIYSACRKFYYRLRNWKC